MVKVEFNAGVYHVTIDYPDNTYFYIGENLETMKKTWLASLSYAFDRAVEKKLSENAETRNPK